MMSALSFLMQTLSNRLDNDPINLRKLSAILDFVRSHGHPEARIACGAVVWRTAWVSSEGTPGSDPERATSWREAKEALGY